MAKMTKKQKQIAFRVPPEIHRQFIIKLAKKETTAQAFLQAQVEKFLKEN